MTFRYERLSLLALLFLSAACSSGGGDGDNGGPPDPVDPQLVSDFRGVISAQGIAALGAAPSYSQDLLDLGQALFFEKEISGNRDVSCATCHLPSEGAADARTLPSGVGGLGLGAARTAGAIVPRNSPTALNAHLAENAFWDSRVELLPMGGGLSTPAGAHLTAGMEAVFLPGLEVLAAQAMLPPTSRSEMRGDLGENTIADIADGELTLIWGAIVARLVSFPTYETMFNAAYPGTLTADLNMAHVGNAIAVFEATAFHAVDSPFQRFLEGDDSALSNAALRGGLDFYSNRARCSVCHGGSTFTDGNHHNIGMPQFGPGKGDGLGGDDDFGREQVTGNAVDRYRFRTPTLLNVELSAPYGHVGQFSTLRSMVDHYRNVTASLNNYSIASHVSDPALLGTQVGNQSAVLMGLDMAVSMPLQFNVDDMVSFMVALTADDARDLSSAAPATVPSGLGVDQ